MDHRMKWGGCIKAFTLRCWAAAATCVSEQAVRSIATMAGSSNPHPHPAIHKEREASMLPDPGTGQLRTGHAVLVGSALAAAEDSARRKCRSLTANPFSHADQPYQPTHAPAPPG